MRYKVVPPARSVAALDRARAALPLVPGSVEDCCSRIRDGTDLQSRDEARECLTFLQALGLAAESERGYHRTRADLDQGRLAANFRENVFGAEEVVEALGTGARTTDEAFADVRDAVPRWERDRNTDWESGWHERTERLLGWAVEFGLVERFENGYKLARG